MPTGFPLWTSEARRRLRANRLEILEHVRQAIGGHYEVEGRAKVRFEIVAVHYQKRVCGGESDPFVAVNKRMIIRQRLHQSCRLFENVVVVAALRPKGSSFNGTQVPDSCSTTERFY